MFQQAKICLILIVIAGQDTAIYCYIVPCSGTNKHPIARMDTILRQCEAPVKIYNSRWFPASNYRFKWSFIAGQGSNIKILRKKSKNWIFFLEFSIDPGGPGGHPGGSRTDSGGEKHPKNQKFGKIVFSLFWTQGPIFTRTRKKSKNLEKNGKTLTNPKKNQQRKIFLAH